jgi:hypothetical protein
MRAGHADMQIGHDTRRDALPNDTHMEKTIRKSSTVKVVVILL